MCGGNPVVYNGRHARASVLMEGRKTKYIREDPEEEDEDQERQSLLHEKTSHKAE